MPHLMHKIIKIHFLSINKVLSLKKTYALGTIWSAFTSSKTIQAYSKSLLVILIPRGSYVAEIRV